MAKFQPSKASLTPRKKALLTLKYAKKAVAMLEKYLEGDGPVPTWVITKINQGASCLGAALSFVSFKTAKEEEETTT
jgi:hypothetical protein